MEKPYTLYSATQFELKTIFKKYNLEKKIKKENITKKLERVPQNDATQEFDKTRTNQIQTQSITRNNKNLSM